ncbi:MAG TPA: TonB-dependent receptor [Candidatus Acidoferrales bacterium]|nr:TonB-dependent receptor [Candidatus Acidoferrales bacterium]
MKIHVRQLLPFSFLAAALLSFSVFTQAQSNAVISGHVTDRTGAAISGAFIVAQPADSPQNTFRTRTGADGSYSLAFPLGTYRVSVASPQMADVEEEFTFHEGQRHEWNVRMELAPLSSKVIVSAQAEPAPANTVASPVTVLTREQIDQLQAISLAPLLATTSGASIARLGPLGGVTSFFLDGGNSNFTKILIDGTPVNEPGGDIDLSNFDVTNVDKIEIVHGATSALFGSDAVDGVVQIFTHQGTTEQPAVTLVGEGGTFNTQREEADVSGVLGKFDYAPAVSYFNSDGQGPNDRFRDTTLSGNFGWKFSDTDQLHLSMRSSASDAGQPGQTLLEPPELGQSSDLHDFSTNLSWDFSTGSHWQHHLAGSDSYFHDFIIDLPVFTEVNEFNRAAFEAQSTYLDGPLAVSLGYDNEVENGSAAGPHERRNNQGGYLETHYQFGRRLAAIAGVRAEDNASFGTRVVPRTGIAYLAHYGSSGFWNETRLRASYGLGIKEPNFGQSFGADPCFPGNPNLAPERSATFNAGIDQDFARDRAKLSVTFFRNEYRDVVSFASCFPGSPCGFPIPSTCTPADETAEGGFGTFFNTDAARAYGAETSIELHPLRWLSVLGNYTYDDTLVLKAPNFFDPTQAPGNRLFLRPLNSANLILNAAFRRMDWNLAGHFVGRETDSDFLGLGFTSNPGWFRLDLGTQFRLRYGFSVLAHAGNLLDRRYSDAVGYPALGLNYLAGVKYTWGGSR